MSFSAPSVKFQAQHHPLVTTSGFQSLEEYCLYLIHLKAYHEVADLARQRVVLDLGCNAGYGSALLATQATTVVGVVVSARALNEAQCIRTNGLHFVLVDGVSLPFADRQFDLVTSFQVIEHIRDYQTYLSEIQRVLAPGGIVVFATPNAALRLDRGMPPWNQFHVREFTASELHSLLQMYFPHVHVRDHCCRTPFLSNCGIPETLRHVVSLLAR
jgi:SAM-dependent methyltransferase